MLQPTASLPAVPLVPAPWDLRGHAWLVAMRLPPDDAARTRFVPPGLRDTVRAGLSVLMCVVYDEAPCGPYRELLFIPGTLNFGDARHPSISRILVSTWDSVVNGRNNWGIPKDRATFEWVRAGNGDRWRIASEGREVCAMEFTAPAGPRLPLRSAWVPGRMGTIAQRLDGRTYYCQPQASGSLRYCRLRQWRFDGSLFPDLTRARVRMAMRIENFCMTFPRARVVD